MGVGAGLYMGDVVKKFTFAISSPDEFLYLLTYLLTYEYIYNKVVQRLMPFNVRQTHHLSKFKTLSKFFAPYVRRLSTSIDFRNSILYRVYN